MPKIDPTRSSAARPVNRRTAAKPVPKAEPVNPMVRERLAAKWAKSKLGTPLAEQLNAAAVNSAHGPISQWFLAGVVASAASLVFLLLAWIEQSWPLAAAGTLALAGGLGLAGFFRHTNKPSQCTPTLVTPLFDAASLQAFDQALDAMAADIDDALAGQLTTIKGQIIAIARLSVGLSTDEHFTSEDRMYSVELVRRYLPDSLQSYLLVAKEQRTTQALEHGKTAQQLLLTQLELLSDELNKRVVKLTHSSAARLLSQQRFLASKNR